MDILEGREYGLQWSRHWLSGPELLQVRVVRVVDNMAEVKVLSRVAWEPPRYTAPYTFDAKYPDWPHMLVRLEQLVCFWEEREQYVQAQREAQNKRKPWSWGRPHKSKRRKWHGLRSEISWEGRNKESRKRANRKTRHRKIDMEN